MKYFLIACMFVVAVPSSFVVAQEQDDAPLPPKRSSQTKIGGGAGFTPFWLFLNVEPVNRVLRNAGAAEFDKGGMPLLGGQGYAYILFVTNLRIGGMGAGGTMTSRSFDRESGGRRDVSLSVSFGGVTCDYVLNVAPRFDLTFGMLLGGAEMEIKRSLDYGRAKVWDDQWIAFGNRSPLAEYTVKQSGSFFVYKPNINLEYSLLRWIGFRLGVSYLGMTAADWKQDEKYDLIGVPNDVSGRGWMINTGIFLGTFVY